jgi:zona occludens toxin
MAIDAYTGLPRSGKSYSVVKHVVIPSLEQGRTVRTNIPLDASITEVFGGKVIQLAADWYTDPNLCDSFAPGEVVILDELWRRWPAGLKANVANIKDKEFLAEHGHKVDEKGQTMRVVLVTQDLSQISAWARDLVDKTYRTTKLDAVGSNKRFRIDIYQGAVTGQKPSPSRLLRQIFDKYEAKFYVFYKSATHSVTGEVGNEDRADKRANGLKRPTLIALLLFVLIAPIFGVWGLSKFFNQGKDKIAPPTVYSSQMVNPPPPGLDLSPVAPAPEVKQAVSSVPGEPAPSAFWRVAGYLDRPDKTAGDGKLKRQVLLAGDGNARRIQPMSECHYFPNGIDVYCDVEGYRATPWSGRSAVTKVFDSSAGEARTVDRGERSEQRPTERDSQPSSGPLITGVPDSEYASRPWRNKE